jgi:transposase-like protein
MKFKIHTNPRRRRRNYSPKFVISLIKEAERTGNVSVTARSHRIGRRQLQKWRRKGISFFERKEKGLGSKRGRPGGSTKRSRIDPEPSRINPES